MISIRGYDCRITEARHSETCAIPFQFTTTTETTLVTVARSSGID
jgi:hypothetical protein